MTDDGAGLDGDDNESDSALLRVNLGAWFIRWETLTINPYISILLVVIAFTKAAQPPV